MLAWAVLFLLFLALIGAPALWLTWVREKSRAARLRQMLAVADPLEPRTVKSVVLEKPPADRRLERILERIPGFAGLPAAVRNSGTKWSLGAIIGMAAALGLTGWMLGTTFGSILGPAAQLLGAATLGALPILYIRRRRTKLLRAFEEQLPDAIDFVARSVRTGNALSFTLQMMIAESSDPLRAEFRRVTQEQSLGVPLESALKGLLERVPLLELRFFVAAILLQRDTGGNLAEILGKLSASTRERLRMTAHIKAASAQGRLTARILTLLPIAVMLMMNVISPAYVHKMTSDPAGRTMLLAAVVAQLIGYVCMKKITTIEV